MRRITISIALAIAVSILLPSSICFAQQAASDQSSASRQDVSPMGSPILGDGTRNYIPIWVKTNYLQSSVIYQDANKNIGVGTTTPAAALDVNGNINTAMTYQIGTSTVLSVGNPDPFSVFLGVSAGSGSGNGNTFLGGVAGFNNSTGSANTFTGVAAGYSSTTGSVNTFTGYNAGEFNTTGNSNTFTGDRKSTRLNSSH